MQMQTIGSDSGPAVEQHRQPGGQQDNGSEDREKYDIQIHGEQLTLKHGGRAHD